MPLSRRELLASLAGVPVAAMSGCAFSGDLSFDGELLAPDFSTAHRIRDGWRPPAASGAPRRHRVVVIGGGISGLSAGWRLDQLGIEDHVVLELEENAGGTAVSGRRQGQAFPWAAHYIPVPMAENTALIELLKQMDVVTSVDADGTPVVAEQFLCREPEERVYADETWTQGLYPSAGATEADLSELQRFRERIAHWADGRDASGRRWFAIPMATGSDDETVRQLDEYSMQAWLRSEGFQSERLHWLVDYCCRDDYGLRLDQTSAWAGLFYFASRLRSGATESQEVITWPEGNGRIVQHLANRSGARLVTRALVTSIRQPQGEPITVEYFDARIGQTQVIHCDDVIFAAPQFVAPHIIDGWAASGRSVTTFRRGGWVVANVFLGQRPAESGIGMAWDNVIFGSRSLGYVNAAHQTGRDHGTTVLTWYYPLVDDDPTVSQRELMRLTWRDWASVVIADLSKAHPDVSDLIERLDVMRWGHAMVRPTVGWVWSEERQSASRSLGRIHFAGTDLSGLALMEEAFDRGIRAAEKCVSS